MSNIRLVTVSAVVLLASLMSPTEQATAQSVPPPRWRATIEMTIGGADADESATFGRISGLAVDAAGRVFVADTQDEQIAVFSATGASGARIGRSGSGPLEFKRLATIAFSPDGLLWARDEGNARMLGLDVSATPAHSAKTVPLTQFTGGSRMPITFEPDGAFIDETVWFDPAATQFHPVRVRRSGSGAITRSDTLQPPPGAFAGVHRITVPHKDASGKTIGMAQHYHWQPFGPKWIRAYGPAGLRADAVTSRYEVHIVNANGTRVRTVTRTVPAVGLSPRERKWADSTMSESKALNMPFGVPKAKAPIEGLLYAQDGRLWVERAVADGRPREADVFDTNGRLIAVAEWPRAIDLHNGHPVIRGNTVTTVTSDADGIERVVRLRFR